MRLVLAGINHRQAPLELRERFSLSASDSDLLALALREKGMVAGAVILSTCQRVELYAEAQDAEAIKRFFLNFKGLNVNLGRYLYVKYNGEALTHLFNVSSGLDSQIIGEYEILQQVRDAYLKARGGEVTTPLLNKLFERALFVGKLVRQQTGISKTGPSIAQSAVYSAEALCGCLAQKKVYIIGAGAIAGKVAQLCAQRGAACIIVANRTFQKAQKLSCAINGRAVKFEEFYLLLKDADILFSATASRHFILKKESFQGREGRQKEIIIFDLAFPRDIDPGVAQLEGIRLFNLDDLKQYAMARDEETRKAFALAREKAQRFLEKEGQRWNIESACVPAA